MGSIYAEDVIKIATDWLGYKEDSNNWTIFAKVLDECGYYSPQKKQNVEWCGTFCWFCILQAAIPEERSNTEKKWDALNYTYQPSKNNLAAACRYAADYFRSHNAWYEDPQVGDVIFFGPRGSETHQGLVKEVKDGRVYTIEGNKNNQVQPCDYSLKYTKISGYGRPSYDGKTRPDKAVEKPQEAPAEKNKENIKEVSEKAAEPTQEAKKTVEQLAKEVYEGKWGNGKDRSDRLTAAGYDYQAVQDKVNELYYGKAKKESGKQYTVTVNSSLRVRAGVGTDKKILRYLYNGEKVTVYETKDGWGRIGNGEWVCMDFLK